jgi:hypothetical protein
MRIDAPGFRRMVSLHRGGFAGGIAVAAQSATTGYVKTRWMSLRATEGSEAPASPRQT